MAFWNAPLDDREHQLNACDAAVDMIERIDELNKVREQEANEGGHAFIPLNVGVGPQHRRLRGRQYGLRPEIQLFGARRQRQPGLAPGRAIQGIRFPDHRRLQHGACGQGPVCDPRARFHHGEGQDGARGHLCHCRARGRRAVRRLPAPAQPDHRDAGVLPQPRLGRRTGKRSSAAANPTTATRSNCSTICTRRGFAAFRRARRRKTGTARMRC